jgi:hypothetical protein
MGTLENLRNFLLSQDKEDYTRDKIRLPTSRKMKSLRRHGIRNSNLTEEEIELFKVCRYKANMRICDIQRRVSLSLIKRYESFYPKKEGMGSHYHDQAHVVSLMATLRGGIECREEELVQTLDLILPESISNGKNKIEKGTEILIDNGHLDRFKGHYILKSSIDPYIVTLEDQV